MADLPSYADLIRIGRNEALRMNSRLAVDAFDREGADANVLNAIAAAMVDDAMADLAAVNRGMYLDGNTGDDLRRLVYDRYQILATPAAHAGVDLSFTTAAPNPGAFPIDPSSVYRTSDGTKFVPLESVVFPAAGVGPVVVRAQSLLAGADQQVRAGTITQIDTAPAGAPSDLAVTNPLASSGAADAESEQSLISRGRLFWSAARRGTVSALELGALATEGVETAAAFETLDAYGRPNRVTQVVVTDSFTESLADLDTVPPAYSTQAAALAARVLVTLEEYRVGGMPVDVMVAVVALQTIILSLGYRANVDTAVVSLAARAAAVTHTNTLRPGEALRPDALLSAIVGVPGIDPSTTTVLTPSGIVTPTPLQVIRTTLPIVRAATV